jgi:hypothetical protein
VGRRVTRLGTVHANTERDAIAEVTRKFDIQPVNRFYKVSDEGRHQVAIKSPDHVGGPGLSCADSDNATILAQMGGAGKVARHPPSLHSGEEIVSSGTEAGSLCAT